MTCSGESPKRLGFLKGNVLVMISTSALWQFAGNLAWPFFSLYVIALGGGPETIGLITGTGMVVAILPMTVGGYLSDRYGRRRVTAILSIILGLTSILMAASLDWRMLLLVVVLESIVAGLREPAMSALIADSMPPSSRGIGFAAWYILPGVPSMISPLIAGYLIDRMGALYAIRWGYLLAGVAAMTAGALRHLFLKETAEPAISPGTAEVGRSTVSSYREMTRTLWILLAGETLLWLAFAATQPYFILYGTTDVIGLTATEWGIILLVSNLPKALAFAFGSIADRYGRKGMTTTMIMMMGISTATFVYCRTLMQVLLVHAANALSILVLQQMFQVLRADVCPRENRGRIYAFFGIWQYSARASGALLGGFLYAEVSVAAPFYVAAGLSLSYAVAFLRLMREIEEREM